VGVTLIIIKNSRVARKNYEILEHTADIRILVKAKTKEELFKNCALAMFDILAEQTEEVLNLEKINIVQKEESLEELFVNWLNELLSMCWTKKIIFIDFDILELDNKQIKAVAIGTKFDNYKLNTEIKAATYSDLEIKQIDKLWQAKVIFDV